MKWSFDWYDVVILKIWLINDCYTPFDYEGVHRDPFPKTDLYGGFIGDKEPLCVDLPEKHFLMKGATYRLLGSSLTPDLHEVNIRWEEKDMPTNVFVLSSVSNLKSALSSKEVIVTLDSTIACVGDECNVDTMRLVQSDTSPPIYYEYVRPKCVELAFYDNGKKITTGRTGLSGANKRNSMCANPNIDAAYDTCCRNPSLDRPKGFLQCYYDLERTTYATSKSRCLSVYPRGGTCDWYNVANDNGCTTKNYWMVSIAPCYFYLWTNNLCMTFVVLTIFAPVFGTY